MLRDGTSSKPATDSRLVLSMLLALTVQRARAPALGLVDRRTSSVLLSTAKQSDRDGQETAPIDSAGLTSDGVHAAGPAAGRVVLSMPRSPQARQSRLDGHVTPRS